MLASLARLLFTERKVFISYTTIMFNQFAKSFLKTLNTQSVHLIYPRISSTRLASQLYPPTSKTWDEAMERAEFVIGNSSDFSNLQQLVGGEFNNITKYLQKLVGTNHPMLETAKRCTYISEGRMGSAQARGLTVILVAKAVEELAKHARPDSGAELIRNQISLAEMTEMTYSAYMIHRGVMDLRLHGLEESSSGSAEEEDLIKHARGIHYGNKVSVLCGDFLLAYVMRGLGDLFSSKVVDLVSSAITDFMEAEFLLLDDWSSPQYLRSRDARDLNRWLGRSSATIGSLQGNTCQAALVLANVDGRLQTDAREFGRNLGIAWQAHTELQPFLREYEPIELPEMAPYPAFDLNCLPVLLFLRDLSQSSRGFNLMLESIREQEKPSNQDSSLNLNRQHSHREPVNYQKLHSLILEHEIAISHSYRIISGYSEAALRNLDSFPPSQAKSVLQDICESLRAN